ncbi:hypothetical protein EJB05_11252, partial [Eragrostis curvula]
MAAAVERSGGCGKKRKCAAAGLDELHDDMLERVLARLPPASFFRLRGVSRRWRAAAESNTFRASCARVPARDPWFLMLSDSAHKDDQEQQQQQPLVPARPAVVFDSAERAWARWRGAPGPVPVAAAGGLLLYRDPSSGELTVTNPLTGASRLLPPCGAAAPPGALLAVAMYGSPYRVVLILGELPDLSMATFDSSTNAWEELSGDVVATNMQRSASRQYSCAVASRRHRGEGDDNNDAVAYFLSHTGTVVACDLARRSFAELPRILPVHHEYSIDVVACDGVGAGASTYVVVLSEFLGAASLRVWEFAGDGGGAWRQVAAMPPAMSQPFYGAKADVNCVGHGDRVMVCVSSSSSGEAEAGVNGCCFMCDVKTNRWEELPRCTAGGGGDGEATDFVAALSFEPRMEAAV